LRLAQHLSSPEEKRELYSAAIETIQESIPFDYCLTILQDCYVGGLDIEQRKTVATKILERCEQPTQVRQLMDICAQNGFDSDAKQTVLRQAKPGNCEINLVLPYLQERQTINLTQDRELLALLLSAPTAQESDRKDFKAFSTRLFRNQIAHQQAVSDLQWWRQNANDQQLYEEAFKEAIEQEVVRSDFLYKIPDLKKYVNNLRDASLVRESHIIRDAVIQQIDADFSH
jgi:hypothetical protein